MQLTFPFYSPQTNNGDCVAALVKSTVGEMFENQLEFMELINQAELNASSNWEINFVSDMQDKFRSWGRNLYITQKQVDVLTKIAEK